MIKKNIKKTNYTSSIFFRCKCRFCYDCGKKWKFGHLCEKWFLYFRGNSSHVELVVTPFVSTLSIPSVKKKIKLNQLPN